jgi:hypothetical protein
MKKNTVLLLLLISTTFVLAQKKEKINGSKTVTIEQKEIGAFYSLEVEDNLEVYLERGEKPAIKIEADDNLHEIITIDLKDNTLRLYTAKAAVKYKKLIVRVTYTNELNRVTAKNTATINAIQEIQLEDIAFKSLDYATLFLNINSKNFLLQSNDKSKIELNLKSEKVKIELSDNSSLKSLISTIDLNCDLYQKTEANIEGDATNAVIRLDNNATFIGNKLTIKNIDLTTESYSNCSINALTLIAISANEQSEIQLYGDPKIEIKQFAGEATLSKRVK